MADRPEADPVLATSATVGLGCSRPAFVFPRCVCCRLIWPLCPIGEALVARIGADIVAAPHQLELSHRRHCTADRERTPGRRGARHGAAGLRVDCRCASTALGLGSRTSCQLPITRVRRSAGLPVSLLPRVAVDRQPHGKRERSWVCPASLPIQRPGLSLQTH
jgi:hypothetical protein